MFQIESPGQRELVGKFGPQTFEDIVIDISLFRPGPVKSDMVTPFLMARNGWRETVYPHPDLEFCLEETAGVVVFHEQVLQIVARMTGLHPRRGRRGAPGAGGEGRPSEVRAWFVPQVLAAGYPVDVAEQVWDGAGRLRLVRLLQGARGGLRAAHLPVGLAQGRTTRRPSSRECSPTTRGCTRSG
jgi:error-prone DNA polymerase